MAAKPKYNAPYHDNWAWSLAAMGATNEEIALAMGVSERTIMRWAKEHESFGKALGEGKGVSDGVHPETIRCATSAMRWKVPR